MEEAERLKQVKYIRSQFFKDREVTDKDLEWATRKSLVEYIHGLEDDMAKIYSQIDGLPNKKGK